MKNKNLTLLVAMVACSGVFAQDKQLDQQKKDQDQQKKDQQGLKEQQGTVVINGTVCTKLDEMGKVKSVEIRDEKGTVYNVQPEGLGRDLFRLCDAKIRATGSLSGGKDVSLKSFYLQSYEATVGLPGKLIEREDDRIVFEEIAFQESPRVFKVLNREDDLDNLDVPFDKEIKAIGTVTREGYAFTPHEGSIPEKRMPQENLPKEGTQPQDGTLPHDKSQQGTENRQAGMDKEGFPVEGNWTIHITTHEPLEYVIGVVSVDKSNTGSMLVKLQEEERGIIFKEKGRTFELSQKGKGQELKIMEGRKVKVYGTLAKNAQGNWIINALAYTKYDKNE